LDVQFGCAFPCRMCFQRNFLIFDTEDDIETHSTGKRTSKRNCNQPLRTQTAQQAVQVRITKEFRDEIHQL
jgi:hypothetical protein